MSASGSPLVSVIVPAFDAEATLAESLASAAAQTYRKLEILIVDDGSSDATPQIAADFCAGEPRARLLGKSNGGVASARNWGIEAAKGEWIAPLDADDLWHPTKIEKQVAAALAAPERPGFVYCWHQLIDEAGNVIASGPNVAVSGRALYQLGYSNFVGNGSALLIDRETLRRHGGYDPSLRARGGEGCEDHRLQLKLASHRPIATVPEYLVGYRSHPGSMSRKGRQMLRSWQLLQEDLGREAMVPAFVRRRVLSACNLWFADAMLSERSHAEALRAFATALRLDPARAVWMVTHRLIMLAIRVFRGRVSPPAGRPYRSLGPHDVVRWTHQIDPIINLVGALDRRRLERLARAEPPPTKASNHASQPMASASPLQDTPASAMKNAIAERKSPPRR